MGALLTLLAQAAAGSGVYYVDNGSASCSNSGPGTEAQPYCTISAAVAARGGPGTTIYVKPGLYREQVSVNVSGAAGSPLVIQALGSPVTIDGADDFSGTGSWTLYSGSVYRAAAVTWAPVQVIVDATRLTPSTASPSSLPVNSYVYVSGQGLYVNLGGGNPGSRQTMVGHRPYCFSMYTRSYVTIDGFNLLRADDRGVNLGSSCTNVTVTHNNASWCWKYGVFASGGSGFLIGHNTCSDNQDHGISLVSGVSGSTIEDNECARNARLDIREANGIYLYGCSNNVLRRNQTHHNQDTGLHIQSGSTGNLLYLNRSWSNGDHGYDHLLATNNIHIGDVAYGNYKDGFSIEGSATGQQLYDCIAIDNGLTTNEFDLWVDSGSTSGFVSDYNIFWNSTSQTPFKYISTQYATLAGYQAASGQDAHSIQANPKFVNAAGGDFHLQSGSPAIDSGNSGVASWPALDADGVARVDDPGTPNTGAGPVTYSDRGSFEYVTQSVPRAPVVSAPGSVSGSEGKLLTVNVTASDPDGDPIASLVATGLPAGATFTVGAGNTSGQLAWTPSVGQAGSYTVTFTASNALSGSATTVLNISPNGAPVVTAPATVNGTENSLLTVNVSAADPDGDPITSLTASGLPAGATFTAGAGNTSGTLSWTPSFTQAGSYTVTFTASNAKSGSATTALVIANSDRAPVVTAPPSASGSENAPLAIDVTASDPDGEAITSLTCSGLPAGFTFTPGPGNTSGHLSWTPSFTQAGSYTAVFTATNAISGTASTAVTIANVDRAPQVTAPAAIGVRPGFPLIFEVTASDPDGEAIASWTASLPPGATFTPAQGNASGTFSWTPTLADVGDYAVTFTASNALTGSAVTAVTVSTTADQNPVVTAPSSLSPRANTLVSFTVTASDPDGNAISSLVASPLPAGATFTAAPGNTSGLFSWTPTAQQQGGYSVSFTASNILIGWATTAITVRPPNQLPIAALSVTPATGNEPLAVTASAAGSSDPDPDGGIASYNFNWGDGASTGPQAGSSAAHTYAAGTWTCTVTVTDVDGGAATASKVIIVAPVGAGTNFIANPSFETGTSGWSPLELATFTRVSGGFDGAYALQISTTKNRSFGVNGNPNTIASTGPAGTRYRCQAWVRAASGAPDVRIRIQEFQGTTRVGVGNSATVALSPTWQMVTLDYVAVGSGHALDVNIIDTPHGSKGPWLLDNISLRIVTGPAPAAAQASPPADPPVAAAADDPLLDRAPLEAVLSPSPLRSHATLTFRTTEKGPLSVILYDLAGRRVRTLLDDPAAPAGAYRLPVDVAGGSQPLAPGMYFYRVRAAEGASTGRFVIAR